MSTELSQEDREANYFAICLLMPEELVRKEVKKLRRPIDLSDDEDIKELANTFRVSIPLMTLRLGQLYLP